MADHNHPNSKEIRAVMYRPEIDDTDGLLEGIREAVTAACLWHKRIGNPIASWENGQVVWIQPEDIHPPETARK